MEYTEYVIVTSLFEKSKSIQNYFLLVKKVRDVSREDREPDLLPTMFQI